MIWGLTSGRLSATPIDRVRRTRASISAKRIARIPQGQASSRLLVVSGVIQLCLRESLQPRAQRQVAVLIRPRAPQSPPARKAGKPTQSADRNYCRSARTKSAKKTTTWLKCTSTRASSKSRKLRPWEVEETRSNESGYGRSDGRQLTELGCLLLYRSEQARRSSSSRAALSRGKKAQSCYCAARIMLSSSMQSTTWTPDHNGVR